MKDFIRFNIENVKGRRAVSLIEKEPSYASPVRVRKFVDVQRSERKSTQPDSSSLARETLAQQQQILSEISEIRSDLRLIKSLIFSRDSASFSDSQPIQPQPTFRPQ